MAEGVTPFAMTPFAMTPFAMTPFAMNISDARRYDERMTSLHAQRPHQLYRRHVGSLVASHEQWYSEHLITRIEALPKSAP